MSMTKPSIHAMLLKAGEVIDIGLRSITLTTKDYGRGKPRFAIYLPTDRSDVWQMLWEKGAKVRVILVVPEEELKKISAEESVKKS
jgi:hypothetical protein